MTIPSSPVGATGIQSLFSNLIDVAEGYHVLVDRADPSIRPLVSSVAKQHAEHIAQLESEARRNDIPIERQGRTQDTDGSARLHDMFQDLDRNVLDAVADGEKGILAAYDDTLNDIDPTHPLATTLRHQKQELLSKVNALSDAA